MKCGESMKKRLIDVAMGREKPDLVLKGAKVLNVFTEKLEEKDVAICDGYIAGLGVYDGDIIVDLSGKYLTPGLLDAHIHLESSLLTPVQFERASLAHGTTSVICDPHEIANVAGTEGIDYMMQLCEPLDMRVWFNMPSCVPACPLEETGEVLEAEDLAPYYDKPNVLGLAEVMNAVGVIDGDESVLQKIIDAESRGRIVDGHAPFLSAKALCAYAGAGVQSDHECTNAAEAIEKISRGQWIMVREGTAAKNLDNLIPICTPPYCYRAMFCTDDRHPEDLLNEGHIDNIIRKVVAKGIHPTMAIKMATFNTASYFGLSEYGAVAPGYKADLTVFSDLNDFTIEQVYIDGRLVVQDGKVINQKPDTLPDSEKILKSFHMQPVTAELIRTPEIKTFQRVIGLKKHELLTDEMLIQPNVAAQENGVNIDSDILKAVVFERHHDTGHIGVGFIHGYGLKSGAVATSVAHDSHNLIVIGTNDDDIAAAANAVREMNGGLVVADGGRVIEALPLPIAGLMSDLPIEAVYDKLCALKAAAKRLGVSDDIDPFMTLAFVSLPVIPTLRLNGKGLIDVEKQAIVPLTF